MKATPMILTMCLILGGCSSCQRSGETPGSETTSAGARGAGVASPAADESGKIRGAPAEGQAPGIPPAAGNLPAPPATAAATETEAEAGEEGDCIVVADANPDYGPPPLSVEFTSEAECSGGQPTYTWDFGDGSPASNEINPTHTYTKPGDYTASVTVSSGKTTASDEIDITVEEGEAPAAQ